MIEHCPRCKSDKHTSLPFGDIVRANGTAHTYRCLVCGFFFVRGVNDDAADVLARANLAATADPPVRVYPERRA